MEFIHQTRSNRQTFAGPGKQSSSRLQTQDLSVYEITHNARRDYESDKLDAV